MTTKNIVFIDSRVAGYETITASFDIDTKWYLLDVNQDGVEQMQRILAGYSELDSVHVISHGTAGTLYLGSTVLNSNNLASYQRQLQAIGSSLAATGDILLYGCNVAQGDAGLNFVNELAKITGADLAASTNTTGPVSLNGNGVLELVTGLIDVSALGLQDLEEVLTVNSAPRFALGDGKLTTDFDMGSDMGNSVAVQADGKILVAGTHNDDFALVRYSSNGSLDTSFSGDGKLTTDFSSSYDRGNSVVVQIDGKILVAGESYNGSDFDFALARYNSDGSLDATFHGDGMVTTGFRTNSTDSSGSAVVQADGKILIAGTSSYNGKYDFALARYNSDGSLDTTFSYDGKVTTDFGKNLDLGSSVVVQADGKILLIGTSSILTGVTAYDFNDSDLALVRYNSDGSLDTSFSGDGKITTSIGTSYDTGSSVVVQADGKILAAGSSRIDGKDDFALVRYNGDGSLDTTFSGDGMLLISNAGGSVFMQADGKILVAGYSGNDGTGDFAVARYNSDGSLNATFSGDGKLIEDIGTGNDSASNVVMQADGKILVAGSSHNGSNWDFALARYSRDGSPDVTFDLASTTLSGLSTFIEDSAPVVLDSNVNIYDENLSFLDNYSGAILTLSRHSGANAEDVFSGAGIVAGQASGKVTVAGTVIGAYAYAAGTLVITYNSAATQALTSQSLRSIAYANTSDAPPAAVQIDWIFNDGNVGAQGTGGALSTSGSTTVTITAVNDVPTGTVTIKGTATQGKTLTASNTLADVDGIPTSGSVAITYQWLADGTAISGANGSTLILDQTQVGKNISVKASYTDAFGTFESKTSTETTKVANVNDVPTGAVTITGAATQGQILTAANTLADADGLGSIRYQWLANGTAIKGATGSSYTLTEADIGKTITATASYTDSLGAKESVTSTATAKVANANDSPTGTVTIAGAATQGQKLTAANTLADADGLGKIGYQWLADGTEISGATASTLTLGQAHVGKTISVRASYTDALGTKESVTSAATAQVANVNDAPNGGISVVGTAKQGQTLTATNTLSDADGLGTISYQWLADGTSISGATDSTFTLTQAQVGKAISVKASYTDGQGTAENKSSTASAKVANVNDAPTGAVNISGSAEQGQTLTVTNTLVDDDGLGTVKYQWIVDGVAIKGATTPSFALTQTHVGKAISVKASYTDKLGTAESVTSAITAKVANVNDAPTGTVTIGGTVTQGQKLTATHKLADADGLGTVSYQWLADGAEISGATASTLTLEQEQVGKVIAVKASYTDGQGTAESKISMATAMVASQSKIGKSDSDLLVGSTGNDTLDGKAGDDVIQGGLGNDKLIGGPGADQMAGGAGKDIFDFNALSEMGTTSASWDVITDFVRGQDKIDLSTLDAHTGTKANDAFSGTLIASTASFTAAGQLKLVSGILYGNTDDNLTTSEFAIQLTGISALSAEDFIL